MTDDRRQDERVQTNLQARWDGHAGVQDGRIEDLSLGGCFVNSTGRTHCGELIVLEIEMPSGEWLQLRGEVTSYQEGIGFGLLFTFLTDDEEFALRELLN